MAAARPMAARTLCLAAALACGGALRLEETRGLESAPAREARGAPPRVALIKFPRTGSTLLMRLLTGAACSSKACEERWAAEVLDRVCGARAACGAPAALGAIRRFSTCDGEGGCGWSLNLFKHQLAGLSLWPQIVEIMAAQPMTVVFLTRSDPAAQFVSYAVGTRRKEVMRSAEYLGAFGPRVCNAYQYYNCPQRVVDWVDNRTHFALDLRQMRDEVAQSRRQGRVYARLEAELREQGRANLSVLHATFEGLHREAAWRELLAAAGLPAAKAPTMLQTDYSRFVSNWADVAALSRKG